MWEYISKMAEYVTEGIKEYRKEIAVGACSLAITSLVGCTALDKLEFAAKDALEGKGKPKPADTRDSSPAPQAAGTPSCDGGYDPALDMLQWMRNKEQIENLEKLSRQTGAERDAIILNTQRNMVENQMRRKVDELNRKYNQEQ